MAYSTLADILKVIPEDNIVQLTDDDCSNSTDADKVTEAISQADSEIDTYVVAMYTVPLAAPVPAVIRGLSCDIAIYKLYKRRMEEIPETRDASYRNSVKLLREIRDGKMPLPIATAPSSSFASGVVETSHFSSTSTIPGLEG